MGWLTATTGNGTYKMEIPESSWGKELTVTTTSNYAGTLQIDYTYISENGDIIKVQEDLGSVDLVGDLFN